MLITPIKPMLLTPGDANRIDLNDSSCIVEPKYDGWRIILIKHNNRVELYTRQGNKIHDAFPEFIEYAEVIQANEAIIDCEGICYHPTEKRPVFDLFQNRARLSNPIKIAVARKQTPAQLIPFDVLWVDGQDLRGLPLLQRKERLKGLVEGNPTIVPTTFVEGIHGKELFEWTRENRWEGICQKRKDSVYEHQRSQSWLKIKHWQYIDTVIMGYRTNPFALVVGAYFSDHKLKPIGVVEFGFSPEEKQAFLGVVNQIVTNRGKHTIWLQPLLTCRIQYLEKTPSHHVRITSFKGFLTNKKPADCTWSA